MVRLAGCQLRTPARALRVVWSLAARPPQSLQSGLNWAFPDIVRSNGASERAGRAVRGDRTPKGSPATVPLMASQPAIIEVAINGATTKERNRNVPRTPDEIAANALACFAAGAAIIHNHIDLTGISEDQAAERYLEAWRVVLAERPDALWYPTVHFGKTMSLQHLAPIAASGLLRLGLTDPGSVNLGRLDDQGVPMAGWCTPTPSTTSPTRSQLCRELQLGPSLAIYEPGFLRATLAYWRAGLLPKVRC